MRSDFPGEENREADVKATAAVKRRKEERQQCGIDPAE